MKVKEVRMKYNGKIPIKIPQMLCIDPGEERDIPEKTARNLQHDRNWEIVLEPQIKKTKKLKKGVNDEHKSE